MPNDIPGPDWLGDWQLGQYSQAVLDAIAGTYGSGLPSQDVLGAAISPGGYTQPPPPAVAELPSTPTVPTGPEPPFVGGPESPFVGPLTPGQLSQVLGESGTGWGGWGVAAASFGDFLFKKRRAPRLSRFERGVRAGSRALERALVNAAMRVIRGPPAEVLSKSRAMVRYVAPTARFAFGRVLGLASLAIPSRLDPGNAPWGGLYPQDIAPVKWIGERLPTMPTAPGRSLGELLKPMPRPNFDTYIPQSRTIPELIREAARNAVRSAVADRLGVDVDTLVGPPAPRGATLPGGRNVPQINLPGPGQIPTPATPKRPIRWGLGTGAIVAGLLVEGLQSARFHRQSGLANMPVPITNIIPTPTPIAPVPLTSASPATLGFGSYGAGGYCEPRPRGPRRKCLQRAPVRYSGGPRKGKAAGTKCIQYARAK